MTRASVGPVLPGCPTCGGGGAPLVDRGPAPAALPVRPGVLSAEDLRLALGLARALAQALGRRS